MCSLGNLENTVMKGWGALDSSWNCFQATMRSSCGRLSLETSLGGVLQAKCSYLWEEPWKPFPALYKILFTNGRRPYPCAKCIVQCERRMCCFQDEPKEIPKVSPPNSNEKKGRYILLPTIPAMKVFVGEVSSNSLINHDGRDYKWLPISLPPSSGQL